MATTSEKFPAAAQPATAEKVTRRDFLTLAWKGLLGLSGALGLAGVWRYFSYQTEPPQATIFDLGPASEYPVGVRANVPNAQASVLHTESGYLALSLVCPHLGCTVDPVETGFACPCHGSRFHMDGSLERGPAAQPLRQLKASVNDAGHLILDTSES